MTMAEQGRRMPGEVTQLLVQFLAVAHPIGGPTIFTIRQGINLHKLLVVPVYVYSILHVNGGLSFDQSYSVAAALLLCLHGFYGFAWVYKDIFFPDPAWQKPMSPLGFVIIFTLLGSYYLPMHCLVTSSIGGRGSQLCPLPAFATGNEPGVLALGVGLYTIGMFYHFGADLQKYVQLAHEQPRNLITTGFFAHSRNPNYFGEIMTYCGYAALSANYTCLAAFVVAWLLLFFPSMMAKEASMGRYKEWDAWAARTGLVVPWLPSILADFASQTLSKLPSSAKEHQA